jgi:hypothetical protein
MQKKDTSCSVNGAMLEVECFNGNQQPEGNRKVSHLKEKLLE